MRGIVNIQQVPKSGCPYAAFPVSKYPSEQKEERNDRKRRDKLGYRLTRREDIRVVRVQGRHILC